MADTASRAEAARLVSVNSTLELERLVKVANAERDKAQERQREAEDESKRCGVAMKWLDEA